MRLLFNIYDWLQWKMFKKKAMNHGFIKLYRPSEVCNLNVGDMITGVNRYEGSITFCDYNKIGKMHKHPSPEWRK